jgi:phosphoribosylanthranilate isomerase
MHRTRIKICGITRPEDALAAAHCGADAIGMVMSPGFKRSVTRERARQLIEVLPPFVTPVALFVDAPIEEITKTTALLEVRHVQLHGSETPDQVAALAPLGVVKAIHVSRDTFSDALALWWNTTAPNLLCVTLDTAAGRNAPGGTGFRNDWDFIERTLDDNETMARGPYVILAGGLTPENVGTVVRAIRPWGVDVSTGVEDSPGVKSDEKMKAFCKAVRDADH